MTAPVRVPAPPAAPPPPAAPAAPLPWRALLRLPVRLLRRGALLLWLAGAVYAVVEVVAYRSSYPDAEARAALLPLADDPAVRTLQGVPHAVDTVGGFVVWDAGWFLAMTVTVWALLATTRLLRGEEDTGRAELVLAGPVTATRALAAQLAVLLAVVTGFGACVAATLVATRLPLTGALLFGAGLAGVGATGVGLAAVAAQLLDLRRRAVGLAAGAVGVLFVLRMLGSSDAAREGLLLTTPYGWLNRLQPFAGDRALDLLPFLLVVPALLALAVRERARRDTGASLLVLADRRRPRLHLLGSPAAFLWRSGQGVLTAWLVGGLLYGVVTGTIVQTVVDLVEDDAQYAEVLEQMGLDLSSPVDGFLSLTAALLALAYALFAAWRVGALRAEEAAGRLDHVLVRPVARRPWLLTAAAQALAAAALVLLASGLGVLLGAVLTGADVGAWQALRPLLQVLPVIALFTGQAVLAFGVAPRLTVAVPATLVVLSYLVQVLAQALGLPDQVVALSPFDHLPPLPGEPFPWTAVTVLCGLAVALTALGAQAFARRDLQPD